MPRHVGDIAASWALQEVFLKAVKDGRAIVTRAWTKVVRAYGMQEGTLWAFRFFNTVGTQNDLHLSLHLYRL